MCTCFVCERGHNFNEVSELTLETTSSLSIEISLKKGEMSNEKFIKLNVHS